MNTHKMWAHFKWTLSFIDTCKVSSVRDRYIRFPINTMIGLTWQVSVSTLKNFEEITKDIIYVNINKYNHK